MEVLVSQIIQNKVLAAADAPIPVLTRRDAALPTIKGKAITVIGMRRAGKTSYLYQCRADYIAAGRTPSRLIYFNFEDERLGDIRADQLHLIADIHLRLFPEPENEPVTLFLDEIQIVPGWETFIRRLLDTAGYEVFLSGSSAKLLSREIATSMRGRAWEITIHPFSFKEFLRHHQKEIPAKTSAITNRKATALDHQFARYLEIGGFPEAQGLPTPERRQLLQGYIDVLLLRDVIERHQVANVTALRWLVRRLLSSPAGLFSVTKFAADMKSQGIAVGRETLYAYLSHIEDAFLLHTIPVATDSEKRRQVNPRKIYPADTALIPVFDRSGKRNTGHLLETAVFIELQRRQADISYVKTPDGYEVDFLARHPDNSEELIQVCTSIDDPGTLAREVRALQDAANEYPRAKQLILTLESRLPFPAVPPPIQVLPAWQWMLQAAEF
ncbi:MAG: ATP-binding protein [Verrucomicrobia bacterium]|nr:ATP-binding protein [Verrucomicrobiota bacterium]